MFTKSGTKAERAHFYRRFREGAMEGRSSYWTGEAALGAWRSANAHIAFLARLKKGNALHKKRAAAAKRGWAKRRANAALDDFNYVGSRHHY